ncbi:MAG: phage terminase large subunit [Alphaproteobacteria bacterium]|nr:phage terminase large subunit [Alphaproteobacteria bacterium]
MKTIKSLKKNIYKLACREYFAFFMREVFGIINPGVQFNNNWHIDMICQYLQLVSDGTIKRLIINIPPRSLKSTIISICWPAWLLGNSPSKRIICASYGQKLADKLSIDTRHLINSRLFSQIFPKTKVVKDQNTKNKFMLTERGFRFATSVGGMITGEGGDILILDDPHNASDINSQKKRQKSIDWFRQTFATRLDNKKDGAIVIVMQRLHHQDLTGFLTKTQKEEWEVLSIPSVALEDIKYNFNSFNYVFHKNTLLHPKREGINDIERIRRDLGSFNFSAQYLQNPIVIKDGMIKPSWINYYKKPLPLSIDKDVVLSLDTAIKSGDNNSYTVCTVWGKNSGNFYLLDVFRDKVEYPALKEKVLQMYNKWNPSKILIEDKSSGQVLLQDLKRCNYSMPLVPIKVTKDKFLRFASVSPLFEYNRVFIDNEATWCDEYKKEILSFPNSINDDQVDSTSQYLNYILTESYYKPRIRQL